MHLLIYCERVQIFFVEYISMLSMSFDSCKAKELSFQPFYYILLKFPIAITILSYALQLNATVSVTAFVQQICFCAQKNADCTYLK